jgi:hypothetical protein
VDTVQNLHHWVKAGVMIRESTAPGSRHFSLFATPTTEKGVAAQRRTSTGGTSVHASGPALAPPVWLKVTRVGDVFRAFYRKNRVDPWALIAMDADFDFTRFAISGSGADIWGTSDAFALLGPGFSSSNMTVTARVLDVENTHPWAKAGVMLRQSGEANAAHVMVIVSPGRGIAMQWRATTGGTSMSTPSRAATAPAWVRLIRAGNVYTGQTSTDGVTWISLGTVTMSESFEWGGLVVTSHDASKTATALFDDVHVTLQ